MQPKWWVPLRRQWFCFWQFHDPSCNKCNGTYFVEIGKDLRTQRCKRNMKALRFKRLSIYRRTQVNEDQTKDVFTTVKEGSTLFVMGMQKSIFTRSPVI
ncbi:hypothetical protein ACEQPO_07180 [Bacillus sp. SL00103]